VRASAVELPGGRDLHWPTVAELDEWRAEDVETWARGRAWRATLAADDPILPYLTPLPDPAAAVFYGESPEGAWMGQPSPDPVIVRAWRYTLTELDAIADDWVADIRARRGGGAAAG